MNMPYIAAVLFAFLIGLAFICCRRTRMLGVCLILSAVAASGYAVALARRYQQNFPLIATGDSDRRVRELLGNPNVIMDGTKWGYSDPLPTSTIDTNVTLKYSYRCIYGPEVWEISFDKNQKVIRKDDYVSP